MADTETALAGMVSMPGSIWRPVHQQVVFRSLVAALARPGKIVDLGVARREARASLAALATLLDGSSTLADPHRLLAKHEWHQLQAENAPVHEAHYVLVDARRSPDGSLSPLRGSPERPERGATIVLVGTRIGAGPTRIELRPPDVGAAGVEVALDGFDVAWFDRRDEWNAGAPLGTDFLLTDDRRFIGLPRTAHARRIA